jgi:U4/U6 small nuclear ribonucleoprotein PRP31
VAEMKRKRAADEDRWFKGGTFTQVGSAPSKPSPLGGDGGFRVPDLPSKKQKTG